jgi:RNA-binding protein YlmH
LTSKNSGKRLDVFLSDNINQYTRSFLKKLIESKQVKLNNKISSSPSIKVKYKDLIIANIVEKKRKDYRSKKN